MIRNVPRVPPKASGYTANPRYAKDVRDFARSGAAAAEVTYTDGKPVSWARALAKAVGEAGLSGEVRVSQRKADGKTHVYLARRDA